MSYLILGGLGFLGQNLCRTLALKGHKVVLYARQSERAVKADARLTADGVTHKTVWGDFETEDAWEEKMKSVTTLFHLVSTTKPSNYNLGYEFESNVLPTVRLCEACVKLGVKIIFFSSGGTVYGVPRYLPIDEQHCTEPISTYGIAKLTIEKCLAYYGNSKGLKYLILRISNPYGIGQDPKGNQGLIGVALARALQGEKIEIWGSGNTIRDYIYVDDLMEAVLAVMAYDGDVHVFNIGNTIGYSVSEIVSMIQRHVKPRISVKHCEGRIQDVPVNILSHEIITEELGWHPRVALDEGLKRMIHAWDTKEGQFLWK